MSAGDALTVGVGTIDLGPLGKIDIGTGVTGELDVGVQGDDLRAAFDGGFEFAGQKHSVPKVDLDVRTASLPGLPEKLAELVAAELRKLFADAAKWAKYVLDGAVAGVEDVGKALKDAYGATEAEAAKALKEAGYAADQVGRALESGYGATTEQAAKVLRGARYGVNEIGGALRRVWNASANAIGRALKGAGFAVNQVGTFLKDVFGLGPDALMKTLAGIGYATNQIKGFFDDLGGAFKKAFEDIADKLDPTKW